MEAFSIATVNFRFHHLRLGGSTPLQGANGDVPLDGFPFLNRVTRMGLHFQ